jgi:pyruvate kinase
MLSGGSANGKYPLEAVEIMNKILRATEKDQSYTIDYKEDLSIASVMAHSVTHLASEIKAKAIFTGAITGDSTKLISFFRPKAVIVAITSEEKMAQELSLVWGVVPFLVKSKKIKNAKDLLLPGVEAFKDNDFLKKGDRIVYRYHEKLGDSKSANTITARSIE